MKSDFKSQADSGDTEDQMTTIALGILPYFIHS